MSELSFAPLIASKAVVVVVVVAVAVVLFAAGLIGDPLDWPSLVKDDPLASESMPNLLLVDAKSEGDPRSG